MKTFTYSFLACLFVFQSFSQTIIKTCKDGDLVFITTASIPVNSLIPQGRTHFNCMGIVFLENGTPMVYYAAEPLRKCSFDDFIKLSTHGKYDIKRLSDTELLSEDVINTMRIYASVKIGLPYDDKLNWQNEAMYNSEFIWKLFKSCVGLPLCKLKEVKQLRANQSDKVANLVEKLGTQVMDEKFVIIGDIYKSDALTDLEE
jgi:hypothetical protein